MVSACVTFELPGQVRTTAGPGGTLGRSNRASIRLAGTGIAAWHARIEELGGVLVLRPMDGAIRIRGVTRREIELRPPIVLGIGDCPIAVVSVGEPPEGLLLQGGWGRFSVGVEGDGVHREITGLAGTLGSALLRSNAPVPWEQLAERLWPDDAALRRRAVDWTEVDERRFRNRWDRQIATLRAFADDLRPGGLVRVENGGVALATRPADLRRST